MGSPIQTLIDDYRDLNNFLMANGQVSESLTVAEHYRKILLLSCASYYETRIVEVIKKFVEAKASDERISAFVSNKAIMPAASTRNTQSFRTFRAPPGIRSLFFFIPFFLLSKTHINSPFHSRHTLQGWDKTRR